MAGILSKYPPSCVENAELPESAFNFGGQEQTRTQLKTAPRAYYEVRRDGEI